MAGLTETPEWEELIYQIEESDAVHGGPPDEANGDGLVNLPSQQLANRTGYLRALVVGLAADFEALNVSGDIKAAIDALKANVASEHDTLKKLSDAIKANAQNISGKLDSSAFTGAAILALLKAVDGSGSGLDADLLDGLNAGSFLRSNAAANASAIITFLEGARIGKNGGGDSVLEFYDDNSNTWRAFFWDDSANDWRLEDNGGTVRKLWHSGNDGSGSGLDADLLDGLHAASFLRSDGKAKDSEKLNGWAATLFARLNATNTFTGLINLSRAGDEQMRLGHGQNRNNYLSLWQGTTRRGYIQARSDRLRITRDGGAQMDILGSGDVRINGQRVWRDGQASRSLGRTGRDGLPFGLQFRFGVVSNVSFAQKWYNVTFSTAFPSACIDVFPVLHQSGFVSGTIAPLTQKGSLSRTGATIGADYSSGATTGDIGYLAIGY